MICEDDFCPYNVDLPHSNYSVFGEAFSVAVPFVNEPRGRLLWVNNDWFRMHGVDLSDPFRRRRIEEWLISTFSIRTAACVDGVPSQFVRADRYGGSAGTAHGGSGRCVYRGRFNVKGAGRTPLIPDNAINHSSGKLGLIEAMRGTIYGELAHLETVKGAIRTVAIIQVPPFDGPVNAQQCLLIRPNFVRPAHAERSLFFGSSGFAGSDQFDDNLRVVTARQVIAQTGMTWSMIAANAAKQIGSLDAVRMAQGRFTSSNMTIHGEVVDFDSFRVFDTWSHLGDAQFDHHLFGWDLEDLADAARTWAWKLASERISIQEARRTIDQAHYRGFAATLAAVVPSWERSFAEPQRELTQRIYHACRANISGFQHSQYGWVVEPTQDPTNFLSRAKTLAREVGFDDIKATVVAARLEYWRRPYRHAKFHDVNNSLRQLILSGSAEDHQAVWTWSSKLINSSRRVYPEISDDLIPLFVISNGDMLVLFDSVRRCFTTDSALGCVEAQPNCTVSWVQAMVADGNESSRVHHHQTVIDWIGEALTLANSDRYAAR